MLLTYLLIAYKKKEEEVGFVPKVCISVHLLFYYIIPLCVAMHVGVSRQVFPPQQT